jgi:hypothetical protein
MKLTPIEKSESASSQPPNSSESMKRRSFFGKAGLGSAALAVTGMGSAALAQSHEDHQHEEATGPLASATVSFGQWQSTPALDRFPNVSDRFRNQHQVIPHEVTIRAGGSVNFIIAGLHHILIYGDGTEAGDINQALTQPVTAPPGLPLLINDPTNRIYRGLDPSLFPQDRVEVVNFHEPGTYFVACGVLNHFVQGMFGYVRVLPCHCQH